MKYGICPFSVVPIRFRANHKSELVSQLLFGDLVEVIEKKGKSWYRVRCQWDNLVGWVSGNQLKAITTSEFTDYQRDYVYNLELLQAATHANHFLPIALGARLPLFDGMNFKFCTTQYSFTGAVAAAYPTNWDTDYLLKVARRYLYTPFMWGGRSPMGIDSAAFIQNVFMFVGIRLPRFAFQQLQLGKTIDFVEQSELGDLAFFENRAKRITHVGMVISGNQIIHAHGCVRIDRLDHFGIFNEAEKRYTHKLRLIKRINTKVDLLADYEWLDEVSLKELRNEIELF